LHWPHRGVSGAPGTPGATGAAGAQGPSGSAGELELVTCTTATKFVKHKKTKYRKCTTKLVKTPAKFTTSAVKRAALTRDGLVFAIGTVEEKRLVLHAQRDLRPGRYTLTLTSHVKTTRQTITIT
jgi:hypothetical protein